MESNRLEVANSVADPRVRRYVRPCRVVWQSEGVDASGLLGDGACAMKFGDGAPGFLLDFGRELHGGVQIERGLVGGHDPVRLRVRFGESVSEAMGEPNNDHAIHDNTCAAPWYGHVEIGNTGFRFVRIDLVDPGTEIDILRVQAVFLYRDLEYRGAFECSDERLNRIWQTGAYTVHLCMQDRLWDGIKRDRLVWLGDMHPETMVIGTVFGEADVVPISLDYVRDGTPIPGWMNGISSYSIWWVLIQRDWYVYHGNRAYLEAQRDYLLDVLALLRSQVGDECQETMGNHRFLDWPSSGDATAIHAGLHALLVMGLEAGAYLCDVLDKAATARECLETARRLRTHRPEPTPSKVANALLALAGLRDAVEVNRDVLAVEPLKRVSTFYGYYVLQARALAGDYAGALDLIRSYWGAMLDRGATTFWEDFNLDWLPGAAGIDDLVPEGMKDIHGDFGDHCYKGLRHSLCHGWAGGPTAWLSQHVLGVRPVEPGGGVVRVKPNLAGLEFARGRFPTPHGILSVEHCAAQDGRIETRIDAPDEIRVVTE
ncbi:MAG TPA: alpha-L-rhamnosidase [Candidatus Hydrogenedentes bacterium]|mgnify:CR=1 FL=1|nr:alpha-L-rhamnosidase [Candidatus Hydrogenedentota bacterium]HPG65222.1 alpha-L-rhamnosidase [Candidatus Hydrogenedentota bacterium]